jgi:O-antigen/teichoic acid export membrane protein
LEVFGVVNLATYSLVVGYFYLFSSLSSGYRVAALKYITASVKNNCRHEANRAVLIHISSWTLIGLFALASLVVFMILSESALNTTSAPYYRRACILVGLNEFFRYLRNGTDIISVAFQKFWFFSLLSLLSIISFLSVLNMTQMAFHDYFIVLIVIEVVLFLSMIVYSLFLIKKLGLNVFHKVSLSSYIGFANASSLGGISDTLFTRLRVILYSWLIGPSVVASNHIATDLSGKIGVVKNNFFKAFEPLLYGLSFNKDREQAVQTYDFVARTNSFLLLIIVIPTILWLEDFLSVWLGEFPDEIMVLAPLLLLRNICIQPMSVWRIALRVEGDVTRYEAQSFVFSILCLSWALVMTYFYRDLRIILYTLILYDFGRHFLIERVFLKKKLDVNLFQFYRGKVSNVYLTVILLYIISHMGLNSAQKIGVLGVMFYVLIYRLIGIRDLKKYVKKIIDIIRDKARSMVEGPF